MFGVLQGDRGNFRYSPPAAAGRNEAGKCIWIVQAYGAATVTFTLKEFMTTGNGSVVLYPESSPGDTLLNPFT